MSGSVGSLGTNWIETDTYPDHYGVRRQLSSSSLISTLALFREGLNRLGELVQRGCIEGVEGGWDHARGHNAFRRI